MPAQRPDLDWLTDPRVFAVNRLPAHSDHHFYLTAADAAAGEDRLRQPLDGCWKFAWSPRPSARPAGFWQPDADLSGFGGIRVPGHMELQGYGQVQYVNTQYPWDGRAGLTPPQIDWDDCPVGSYVRDFVLADRLAGRRVCVSFQGVEQAFYLWCNGSFVGYSEDSFTPADFDLTGFLRPGVNRLCVEVYKHCSGGWLEDQDMFRFSGIFRPVFLYAKPELHIEDLWLRAGLEKDNATGTLAPRLRISAAEGAAPEGCSVRCAVTGPDGALLYDAPLALQEADGYLAVPADAPIRLVGVRPWCHADPALYTVTLTLLDAAGRTVEVVPYRTGFRRFALEDGLLRLNGERIVFHGVNRHEWNPETGRAIGPEDMRRAMETLRSANIDAVRTCHYLNQSLWYDMCDENGIYMIDETNLESHGCWQPHPAPGPEWQVPGSLPQWRDCVLDRARSMLERDKNHTAVLFWSCGNESDGGENFRAMAEFFRQNDPGRLVHYEGIVHRREFEDVSDVESRMYAHPDDIRAYLENDPKKPFVLCEYMHDMGNSIGGMERYIRLSEEFPQYQGGFIWDYMDQALWRTDALGRRVLGYGGDFCDRPSDYAFSADGIVFADGTGKPALQEVRYWYAPADRRAAFDAANAAAAAEADAALEAGRRADAGRLAGAPALRVVRGDNNLGVYGADFGILFSQSEGGPASMTFAGREWLWRAPRLAFWRAATENDLGNGFARRSSVWQAADAWQQCTGCTVEAETPQQVRVRCTYTAPAAPGLQGSIVYTVDALGGVRVEADCTLPDGLPQLPCFGVRFATPAPVDTVEWQGLSGETYPDRYKGGRFGMHSETPGVPAYLVPQECGCHVGTRRVWLRCGTARLPLESCGAPFAFSALPYTPQQLDAAAHREELPPAVRTVVTVYGAMRGVGGIDSWYADVEPAWHVTGSRQHAEFRFTLYNK